MELADRVCELERLSARLEALRCRTLAAASDAVEVPGACKALGFRHAIDLVAGSTKTDLRALRRLAKLGQWLIDLPIFAEAFADGQLTERHVRELHKLDNHKVHHQLVESQQMLVDAARNCDFSDFINVLAYWLNASDPDGCEPSEQMAKTTCSYKKHADGSVTGRFSFDALTGQAFRRLLGLESQKLFREEAESGVTRTPTKRQGKALINLMVRGSQSGGNSSIAPLINLVMGQELAETITRQLCEGLDVNVEPDHNDINRRCELDDGTPIHPRLAAAALAVGRFRRIVFDSDSRPVDVAVKLRAFPPWMRHVLLIRARGRCQIPGRCLPKANSGRSAKQSHCDVRRSPGSKPTISTRIREADRRGCPTGKSSAMFAEGKLDRDLRSSRTAILTTNGSATLLDSRATRVRSSSGRGRGKQGGGPVR